MSNGSCVNNCVSYVGALKRELYCPECDTPRFFPCTQNNCKGECGLSVINNHNRVTRTKRSDVSCEDFSLMLIERKALEEGLFPDSENVFEWHEILDRIRFYCEHVNHR